MNKIMFISAILLCSSFAFADWAKESDFPFIILNSDDVITVDKDGLSDSTFTSEFQATNEEGRNFLVLQSYPVSPDSSTVTFVKGFSKTEGTLTSVNPKDIKTRNSSMKNGMTNRTEMLIPFSNIQIGSSISFTVREKEKKNLVKGLFHRKYTQGLHAPERAGKAKIKSLLPLYVNINDPWKSIQSKQYKEGKYFVFEFEQTKPLFKVPTEYNPILKKDTVTTIDISTMNDWKGFATTLSEKYEKSLKAKIFPPAYNTIIEKAGKAPTVHEKIDIVTSELAKVMTYSGDWTSFEKGFIPRNLTQVALQKTGDCKDFSVATTAMLRKMGIKANVAMVKRTDNSHSTITFQRFSDTIVDPSFFNHAIVKVKDGDNVIWVDPTNIVSNSSYVFTDIAGSAAVEIAKDSPGLETLPIPPLGATHLTFDKTIKVNADGSADTTTNFEATGDFVKLLLETSFAKNEETAKKYLTTLLRSDSKNSKAAFEGVDFKTRVAKNFKGVQNAFGEIILQEKENKKLLSAPPPLSIAGIFTLHDKRVTDVNMQSVFSESSTTRVKGYDFVGYHEGCTILTPWFTLTRNLIKDNDGFRIEDEMQFKKVEISAEDVNSEKFQYHVSDVGECLSDQIEIKKINPNDTLATRLKEYTYAKAKEEYESPGPKSITGSRHAYHIVNQILAADPNNKDALLLKARAVRMVSYKHNGVDRTEYLDASQSILDDLNSKFPNDPGVLQQKVWVSYFREDLKKMSEDFKAAFAVSPKDHEIYILGAEVADKMSQKEAALGSFIKALNFAKTNAQKSKAAVGIAEILIDKNDVDKGIAYYKYAIKTEPENTWLAGNFASLIQSLGRWDDAIEVAEEAIKTNSYGMAKKTLASAYAGKAGSILMKGMRNPAERQKVMAEAESIYSKGLSHDPTNAKCLQGMIDLYWNMAMMDKNPATAQKGLSYLERALSDKRTNPKQFETQKMFLEAISNGKEPFADGRKPASMIKVEAVQIHPTK